MRHWRSLTAGGQPVQPFLNTPQSRNEGTLYIMRHLLHDLSKSTTRGEEGIRIQSIPERMLPNLGWFLPPKKITHFWLTFMKSFSFNYINIVLCSFVKHFASSLSLLNFFLLRQNALIL